MSSNRNQAVSGVEEIATRLQLGRVRSGAERWSRIVAALHDAYEAGYAAGRGNHAHDRRPRARPHANGPRFSIYALGRLRVERDGRRLELRDTRKALSLLALLIANADAQLDADVIAEALWPRVPADSTSNRLNIALHYLRGQLGIQPGDEPILRDRSTFALEPSSRCWLDVAELRSAAASSSSERKHRALDLYRGHLLQDFPWDEWVLRPRDELREEALQIVRELTDAALRASQLERAAACLRRGLAIDPGDGYLRRQIVALERDRGRPTAAERYLAYRSR